MNLTDSDASGTSSLWWTISLCVVALAAAATMPFIIALVRRPPPPVSPPVITMSVLVDGQAVDTTDNYIYITQNSTMTVLLNTDWGENTPGHVQITLCGRAIEAGEPVRLTETAGCLLDAQIVGTPRSNLNTIGVMITPRPHFRARASIKDIVVEVGEYGATELDIYVQLFSDSFNMKDIDLAELKLQILDETGRFIAELAVDADTARSPDQSAYDAYFQDDSWFVHFSLPQDAPLFNIPPPQVMAKHIVIKGSGWQGEERVDFTVQPKDVEYIPVAAAP